MPVYFQDLIKFIRTVSRLLLRESDRDYISAFVKRDVPWNAIADLAQIEGVEGFLYRHLKDWDGANIPENILKRLSKTYHRTRENTLRAKDEIWGFSDWFTKLDISTIALQGLSLLDLYGDPGMRALGDIDLLIRPSDKKKIKTLLRSLGYSDADPRHPDIHFGNGIWIDLHSHILNLDRIHARKYIFTEDLSPMWKRARPLLNHKPGIMRLDPLDNIIALSAHALKHSYSRLIWLVDINESIRQLTRGEDGWAGLVERAKKWRQEKIVLYALLLVQGAFHTIIPGRIKEELGIHEMGILEKHLLRMKLRGFSSTELYIPLWFLSIQGFGRKVRLLMETFFPRNDVMGQIIGIGFQENRSRAILERVVRGVRILWGFCCRAASLSFKNID